jgi:cytochrome c-type biogenesis protein
MQTEWILNDLSSGHTSIILFSSFLGGIVSSLLPCSLGMLPVLVGYMGGYNQATKRSEIFLQVCLFILGVSIVLTLIGILTSLLGLAFGGLIGSDWYYAIGFLAVVMGLQLLGVFQLPLPQLFQKLPETQAGRYITPLILGMAFGLASSPCGTPFLSVILGLMSQEHNWILGGSSLFCYALGQGMLLLLVGIGVGVLKHLATLRKIGFVMNIISGWAFILTGIYLVILGSGRLGDLLLLLPMNK